MARGGTNTTIFKEAKCLLVKNNIQEDSLAYSERSKWKPELQGLPGYVRAVPLYLCTLLVHVVRTVKKNTEVLLLFRILPATIRNLLQSIFSSRLRGGLCICHELLAACQTQSPVNTSNETASFLLAHMRWGRFLSEIMRNAHL